MTPESSKPVLDEWYFLRGLARESGHWGDFPERLCKALGAGAPVYLDLPGTGRRFAETSPGSIIKILRSVRTEAGFPKINRGRKFLFSLSLGSMVATEWAHNYPSDFTGMVVVNTSFKGLSPLWDRLSLRAASLILRALFKKNPREQELLILKMISNRHELYESTANAWANLQSQHPMRYQNVLKQLAAAAFFRPSLARPKIPVLVLNSLADKMVSPRCSERIANAWKVPLERNQFAGHDLVLDDPEWAIEKTKYWLERL